MANTTTNFEKLAWVSANGVRFVTLNHNDDAAMRSDFVLHGQQQQHNDEAGMRETRLTPTTTTTTQEGLALAGLEKDRVAP